MSIINWLKDNTCENNHKTEPFTIHFIPWLLDLVYRIYILSFWIFYFFKETWICIFDDVYHAQVNIIVQGYSTHHGSSMVLIFSGACGIWTHHAKRYLILQTVTITTHLHPLYRLNNFLHIYIVSFFSITFLVKFPNFIYSLRKWM